jgi:tRNA-Thr(GGU) m(6)t(6)A37 methyltransferase TsaA
MPSHRASAGESRFVPLFASGAPKRIRTSDLRLRRPTLYPAELWAPLYLEGALDSSIDQRRQTHEALRMSEQSAVRPGELAVSLPDSFDAGIYFIGRIRTPFTRREECPKNSRQSDAAGTIELDARYAPGLADLSRCSHVILLYWMDRARRDLVLQVPAHLGHPRGVFALRSPVRPNPIALSVVELLGIEGDRLRVRNIDCLDGTPLLDIKPYFASTDSVPDARRP